METTIFHSRFWTHYDAADACCNARPTLLFLRSTRNDWRRQVGLTQGLQVAYNIELIVQV